MEKKKKNNRNKEVRKYVMRMWMQRIGVAILVLLIILGSVLPYVYSATAGGM